jgi:predicted alpha/beta hydrolase family esterase
MRANHDTGSATILIVPGLRGHVPEHWQTVLAEQWPGARTVAPLEIDGLSCAARIVHLDAALAAIAGPVILAAHSAGVLTVARWAARYRRPIAGALLVTPPDLDATWPAPYPRREVMLEQGWTPLPPGPLPFPTIVAASSNDPLASLEAARRMAAGWGSELLELGAVGHMNPASGFGPWPQAIGLLQRLQWQAQLS